MVGCACTHHNVPIILLSVALFVLGVRIDTYTKAEISEKLRSFFTEPGGHIITTPNPEILVAASRDTVFKAALNAAPLNVCDGRGIELFANGNVERFPGVDLLLTLIEESARQQKKVFLLGTGSKEVLEKAGKALQVYAPNLIICGTHPGISLHYGVEGGIGSLTPESKEAEDGMVDAIIAAAPDVLVVAFSHGKQELWITEHLGELPSVKIAIGIGGSLDTLSGKTPRAPLFMRRIGIEWLWRLLLEPKRIGRIITAVFVFPALILLEKMGFNQSS